MIQIAGTREVAPLYEFEVTRRDPTMTVHVMRLFGGRDLSPFHQKIEKRINEFSDRTGLSLSQIYLVKVYESGEAYPQWNGKPNADGLLRTSGNRRRCK